MPIYEYACKRCKYVWDELKKVADRHEHPCPQCGKQAKRRPTTANFDPRMGCDPAFTTAWDKWAKKQWAKNKKEGGMWDSNNNRYGGDHEK